MDGGKYKLSNSSELSATSYDDITVTKKNINSLAELFATTMTETSVGGYNNLQNNTELSATSHTNLENNTELSATSYSDIYISNKNLPNSEKPYIGGDSESNIAERLYKLQKIFDSTDESNNNLATNNIPEISILGGSDENNNTVEDNHIKDNTIENTSDNSTSDNSTSDNSTSENTIHTERILELLESTIPKKFK
jgi:hypothetical protein